MYRKSRKGEYIRMIIPMYHGRPMRLIKKYPNHVLFEDVKTGVRMSFNYYELQMKETQQIEELELKQYKRTGRKHNRVR